MTRELEADASSGKKLVFGRGTDPHEESVRVNGQGAARKGRAHDC